MWLAAPPLSRSLLAAARAPPELGLGTCQLDQACMSSSDLGLSSAAVRRTGMEGSACSNVFARRVVGLGCCAISSFVAASRWQGNRGGQGSGCGGCSAGQHRRRRQPRPAVPTGAPGAHPSPRSAAWDRSLAAAVLTVCAYATDYRRVFPPAAALDAVSKMRYQNVSFDNASPLHCWFRLIIDTCSQRSWYRTRLLHVPGRGSCSGAWACPTWHCDF